MPPRTCWNLLRASSGVRSTTLVAAALGIRGQTMLVRVLHAYSASDEAELSVQPEERLTLIEGDSEGWVRLATLDGQRQGFVPASYVMLELAGDNEGSVTSHDSHDSDGSFTTVAPSRAAQPNIIAAKALGAQLADRLAAATSRDALEEPSASSGFYEPFGDLKVDERAWPSTAEEEELVAPWDSVSCLGEQPSRREEASRGRGLRILPHDDERPSQAKGGVRVVRPATLQVLLGAAHAKQAALWPGAPLCAHLALYDEEGCEVGALGGKSRHAPRHARGCLAMEPCHGAAAAREARLLWRPSAAQ